MSKFSDLLKQPLPSQRSGLEDLPITEAAEDNTTEGCGEEGCCGKEGCGVEGEDVDVDDNSADVGTDDIDDIEDDLDFDPDELDDDELAAIDADLSGDALDDVVGNEPEVTLSPEEEMNADDMMSSAATALVVKDALTKEERADFIESGEAQIAVNEGLMEASDIELLKEDLSELTEAAYNKKMIIRLDAASKKKQLFALAVNVSAAAHNDPDYRKLKKVMRVRKVLRARLTQKYRGEATKRMKVYFNRLRRSKSNTLSKIAGK